MYLDIFLAQVMEEMYGLGRTPLYSDETPPVDLPAYNQSFETFREQIPIFGSPTTDQMYCASSSSAVTDATSIKKKIGTGSEEEISNAIRAKIASHPLYPKLLQSYIDCQKVGAPSDIVDLFDEIPREKDFSMRSGAPSDIVDLFDEIPREKDFSMRFAASTYLGEDPELDEFMETYCEILNKYKSDLARPYDEATTFLKSIENQLRNLCNGATRTYISGAASNSEGDLGAGEIDVQESRQMREDRELKDKLFRKYSGYISSLKREFSNKKKKVKLPREARQVLLDWWAIHYMWPYPTEGDKVALAESAGLDQKQINNWFINQRKRHWKPSANMQFDVMESIDGQLLNE